MDALKSICEVYADTDSDQEIRPSKRLKSSDSSNSGHDGSTSSSPPTIQPFQPSPVDSVQPSPPMDAIQSIVKMYHKMDPLEQIEPLISFLENQLHQMNISSEAGSSSQEGWLEAFPDGVDSAAKTVDTISSETEKLSNSEDAVKEIGKLTLKVVKGVGESYWVFIGLSVATFAAKLYLSVACTEKECRELLLSILQAAREVKLYSEQMSYEKEKLCNVVAKIVESTVMLSNYQNGGNSLRCWSTAAAQLAKTNQQLTDVRDSLGFCVGHQIIRQATIAGKDFGEDKDVFLSHSGHQKNFVRQLHLDLRREHVSCFFDEDDKSLPVGHEFPRLIFKAAETCKIAVLVISKEFLSSKWPMLELSALIRAKKSGKNVNLELLPIFFKIKPEQLNDPDWQELKVSNETRIEWEEALREVRKIKGLTFYEKGNKVHLRGEVVKKVRSLLQSSRAAIGMESQLLQFQPEGLEGQITYLKKSLDIGGSEQAIAGVIVGFAGIGKSTLAASVIQSLNLSSTDFKFSMVAIDERIPDKISHILKLQTDIISHFTGDHKNLQGTEQGRREIRKAMEGKSCFLYMDNVVDSYYVKELLPRPLLPENPSANEKQKTKIRIIITSRENHLKPLLDIRNFVHHVQKLSGDTAEKLLKRTIVRGDKPAHHFNEENKINELAEACRSIPLLLSIFGNHLKDQRDKDSYDEAIKSINEGNIDRYSTGQEELLSETLLYVYDKMKDEEAKEAFLDICTYFHGWKWNLVSDIEDSATLRTLHNKNLVSKSEADTVIVHDILRLMGAKRVKDTRPMNYEEFFNINDHDSKLEIVKGLVLKSRASLITLETKHLNAMRHSLRFLVLGDWIRVEGRPCDRAFENLRYLDVGDLNDFPFKDVSKMKKLNVFFNGSKPGMELTQLPLTLKQLSHHIPYPDCNEFARLPIQNLKSLKKFTVQTKRSDRLGRAMTSVRLPRGLKLPASLEHLRLISCEQLLPETLSHLSALQTLTLNQCDLKCLPQEFTQSVELRSLTMRNCTHIISLADNIIGSFSSLRDLNLEGCTRLEKLPADLGTLTALQQLNIGECKNLRVLPENIGGLKSLKAFDLYRCISLQRLPESLGMLRIEDLNLCYLNSLKELPESMGDLSCLKRLRLFLCRSLEFVPDSVGQLTNLEELNVWMCAKVGALPKSFEQLSSLKEIALLDCPSLRRLPDGLQSLRNLKSMSLSCWSSVVHLPACFEMLSSLESLSLDFTSISSLPDGLGKLKKLRTLNIRNCGKLEALPQGFEKVATLEKLYLRWCPVVEGRTMDKIVKLQNCWYVGIEGSTKLIERWNEMEEESKKLPMMIASKSSDEYLKELDRVRRLSLLSGNCIRLDGTSKELIHHSSLSIPTNTTMAVISQHLDQRHLFQPFLEMAQERARRNCAGQLRIVYVCRRSDDASNEEDETEKIRQTLMMLPQGISYLIPSTDIRRLSLINQTCLTFACFLVDVREDDEGNQLFKDGKYVTDNEISKKSDGETEISDGVVEFINCICESKTQSTPGQCSSLPEETTVGEFIQKLKNNNIHHFSDNKVEVDRLQGKTVAIILIDENYPECIRLQQIYDDIKLKHSDFEALWIPLEREKYIGFRTYSRAIECMPWLTVDNPNSIKIDDIKDKSRRVIIINSGGSVGNPNAISLLMGWGADAYPFTKGYLSQLNLKSSLEILFHSTAVKELNNKVIFLYAEDPRQELTMKSRLEKLVQIHGKGNFEIVYVGRFFPPENAGDCLKRAYEDATESMNWSKLSFGDMMTFWYRLKYFKSDEVLHEPTISRLVNALYNERRWLVVVDGDGMVTADGIKIAEMACESSGEIDDVDIVMREELRESLREGKCSEAVRTYLCDELNYSQHPHPVSVMRWCENSLYCNRCHLTCVYNSNMKRTYTCRDCSWFLCGDCWKEFVKEERAKANKHRY